MPLLAVLLLSSHARAACEEPGALVALAEDAVIEARFEDTNALLARAEAALACREVADKELIARMFLVQGAWMSLSGAEDDASAAFASAHRVHPETWNENLGPQLRNAYEVASSQEHGEGEIRLAPDPEGMTTALDGEQASFPVTTPAGMHLVQILEEDGTARYARIVLLPSGDTLTLEAILARAPEVAEPEARRFPTLLVAGGGAAALAGGAALLAMSQNDRIGSASTTDALNSAFQRQKVFAWSSYGLAGLAATGVTLHFVL